MKLVKLWWHCLTHTVGNFKDDPRNFKDDHRMVWAQFDKTLPARRYCTCGYEP